MKFKHLLLLGVLCVTISLLRAESDPRDFKELKIKDKKPTSEKKSFEKKTDKQLPKESVSASLVAVAVTPIPDELPDLTTVVDDYSEGHPLYTGSTDQPERQEQELDDASKKLDKEAYNITDQTLDQKYFLTEFITVPERAKAHWIELSSLPKHQVFKHDVLSESHRRAASISLPFKFPFYGNNLTKATIATGGFLYMGEHIHSWLAATQYIAPLMAHFDTRNSTDSNILYGYNSTLFVIQWEKVNLLEKSKYEFTFQCVLYRNGDIAFVYKDIPIPIQDISDAGHPVKIGVSDAYFISRQQIYLRRKTIYEYHKVDMINSTISNNTAIFLKAKQTCIAFKSCSECVSANIGFECTWCPAANRCSDGYDRDRQDWITNHCDQPAHFFNNTSQCTAPSGVPSVHPVPIDSDTHGNTTGNPNSEQHKHYEIHDDGKPSTDVPIAQESKQPVDSVTKKDARAPITPASASGGHWAATLMLIVTVIASAGFWVMYAYRNPTTPSGQLLIRWRPQHWRSMYSETRYQAASIHM